MLKTYNRHNCRQQLFTPRRTSPVDGAGPKAVGGPVTVPGPNALTGAKGPSPVPPTSDGPSIVVGRMAVGADRVPLERTSGTERLAAAANPYGLDDVSTHTVS